jgi:hypothetical protein
MLDEDDGETGANPAEPSSPPPPSDHSASSEPALAPPPIFHPLAYRGVVANWPIEWRERWGLRANSLEEDGLSWRDAETQAFVEIWNQLRHQPAAQAAESRVASNPERN